MLDLVRARPGRVDERVPAAPEWRVRDVVAHCAGVCDDIVHGNLGGAGTDPWTAVQVEKRRSWDVDALLTDWEEGGAAVDTLIDGTPPGTFGQLLFDVWTHEQDLRGAFDAPGRRDSAAGAGAYAWALGVLAQRDADQACPALELVCVEPPDVIGEAPVASSVQVSRFELLRTLTGRRSVDQILGFEWTGIPDPERLVFQPLFRPRSADLVE